MRRGGRKEVVQLVQQAVACVPLARHRAALQVGDHFVEALAQGGAVGREDEHEHSEPDQHDQVKGAVDRDQAQHRLIAQAFAAQRQLELGVLGRMAARGRLRPGQGQPAVAAQAAMPARARGVLAREDRVPRAQLGRVRRHQLVAARRAPHELPMQARAPALGRLCAGRTGLGCGGGLRRGSRRLGHRVTVPVGPGAGAIIDVCASRSPPTK